MAKKILTVGLQLASDEVQSEDFDSTASLLDWDIILFRPTIWSLDLEAGDDYKGKPCLTDTASFKLKEASEHWRRQIKEGMETGKTIIVFLPEIEEVYVATGEVQYTGTGRNARRSRVVSLHSNYTTLPTSLNAVNASGSSIKLAPRRSGELIAPYWTEFGAVSQYKVLLRPDMKGVCLLTKHADRPVGAILRAQDSAGSLVLLPDIDFDPEGFSEEKDGEFDWTDDARRFAVRMIGAVVALDMRPSAGTRS
jgi:hypothetical protein